jgi:hypothetical protein
MQIERRRLKTSDPTDSGIFSANISSSSLTGVEGDACCIACVVKGQLAAQNRNESRGEMRGDCLPTAGDRRQKQDPGVAFRGNKQLDSKSRAGRSEPNRVGESFRDAA